MLQGSFSTTFLFSITKFKPATPNLTRLAPLHHYLVSDTHLEIFYQEIYLQSFSLTKSVWGDWDWGGGRETDIIRICHHDTQLWSLQKVLDMIKSKDIQDQNKEQ